MALPNWTEIVDLQSLHLKLIGTRNAWAIVRMNGLLYCGNSFIVAGQVSIGFEFDDYEAKNWPGQPEARNISSIVYKDTGLKGFDSVI